MIAEGQSTRLSCTSSFEKVKPKAFLLQQIQKMHDGSLDQHKT